MLGQKHIKLLLGFILALTSISQANIGKSDTIYLLGEGSFLRSIPGLDDIDPLSGIFHIAGWPDFYALGKYYGIAGIELRMFTNA